MPDLTLYHCPPACSRVTMAALEETGLPYKDSLVKLMEGQQRTPEYLAINPKGKVPALRVDDIVITENPVIISYLDQLAPHARLLPPSSGPAARAVQVADLVWASSTLQVTMRQILVPFRLTDGDVSEVKAKGMLPRKPSHKAQTAKASETTAAR